MVVVVELASGRASGLRAGAGTPATSAVAEAGSRVVAVGVVAMAAVMVVVAAAPASGRVRGPPVVAGTLATSAAVVAGSRAAAVGVGVVAAGAGGSCSCE